MTFQHMQGFNKSEGTYNLEFHGLSFKVDGSDLKVHTNCTKIAIRESILCESQQQARLG